MNKFAFIPKGIYKLGQFIEVHGKPMRVEDYNSAGTRVTVITCDWATTRDFPQKLERIFCICI